MKVQRLRVVEGHMEIVEQSPVPMGMWVVVGGLSAFVLRLSSGQRKEKGKDRKVENK